MIPVEHTLVIREVDDSTKHYRWELQCSCQWAALAWTRQVAEMWAGGHAKAQALRGNHVIIEVRALPCPTVASEVKDAGQV